MSHTPGRPEENGSDTPTPRINLADENKKLEKRCNKLLSIIAQYKDTNLSSCLIDKEKAEVQLARLKLSQVRYKTDRVVRKKLNTDIIQLQEQLKLKDDEIKVLQERPTSSTNDVDKNIIDKLREELDLKQKEIQTLKSAKSAATTEKVKLDKELAKQSNKHTAEVAEYKTQLTKQNGIIVQARKVVEDRDNKLKSIQCKIDEKDDKIKNLEKQNQISVNGLELAKAQADKEKRDNDSVLNECRKQIVEKDQELKRLKSEINQLKLRCADGTRDSYLKTLVDNQAKEIVAYKTAINEKEVLNKKYEDMLKNQRFDKDQKLKQCNDELEKLKNEHSQCRLLSNELQTQMTTATAESKRLRSERDHESVANKKLKEQGREQLKKVAEMEAHISALTDNSAKEIKRREDEMKALIDQVEKLRQDKKDCQKKIDELKKSRHSSGTTRRSTPTRRSRSPNIPPLRSDNDTASLDLFRNEPSSSRQRRRSSSRSAENRHHRSRTPHHRSRTPLRQRSPSRERDQRPYMNSSRTPYDRPRSRSRGPVNAVLRSSPGPYTTPSTFGINLTHQPIIPPMNNINISNNSGLLGNRSIPSSTNRYDDQVGESRCHSCRQIFVKRENQVLCEECANWQHSSCPPSNDDAAQACIYCNKLTWPDTSRINYTRQYRLTPKEHLVFQDKFFKDVADKFYWNYYLLNLGGSNRHLNLKIGSYVTIMDAFAWNSSSVIQIKTIFSNSRGKVLLSGYSYSYANEFDHLRYQGPNELYRKPSDCELTVVPIDRVLGFCHVTTSEKAVRMWPRGIEKNQVYYCDFKLTDSEEFPHKLQINSEDLPFHDNDLPSAFEELASHDEDLRTTLERRRCIDEMNGLF